MLVFWIKQNSIHLTFSNVDLTFCDNIIEGLFLSTLAFDYCRIRRRLLIKSKCSKDITGCALPNCDTHFSVSSTTKYVKIHHIPWCSCRLVRRCCILLYLAKCFSTKPTKILHLESFKQLNSSVSKSPHPHFLLW